MDSKNKLDSKKNRITNFKNTDHIVELLGVVGGVRPLQFGAWGAVVVGKFGVECDGSIVHFANDVAIGSIVQWIVL